MVYFVNTICQSYFSAHFEEEFYSDLYWHRVLTSFCGLKLDCFPASAHSVVSSSIIATLLQLLSYSCFVTAALLQPLCYSCFDTVALMEPLCYSHSFTTVFLQALCSFILLKFQHFSNICPILDWHVSNNWQLTVEITAAFYSHFVIAALLKLLCHSCSHSVVSSSVIATLLQLLCYSCSVIATLLQLLCCSCFATTTLLQPLCYSCSVTVALLQLLCYIHSVTVALLQLLCYICSVTVTSYSCFRQTF